MKRFLALLSLITFIGVAHAQTFDYTPLPLGSLAKAVRDDLQLEYTGINTNKIDFVDIDTCSEIAAIVAGETGTCGSVVLSNSPALVTPNLGTPSAVVLTNGSGLPVAGLSDATANGRSLISSANYASMRGLLDLEAGTDFYSISAANAAFQSLDSDLTSIAALTTTAYGRALLAVSDEATLKALINAEAGVDFQAFDSDLTTWAGLTPSANGQSLVTSASYASMRALLDLEVGTDFLSIAAIAAAYQPLDADLTLLAAGTFTDPNLDQIVWWDDSQGRFEFMAIADMATEAAPTTGDYITLYGAEGDVRKVDWSSLPGVGGGISNIVEDATPQLGGTLDTNGNAIELGTAATDTSVVRSSAGHMSVEGKVVYMAGDTDVALADGGTGASLADPNADKWAFWDDSAGAVNWLTMGTAFVTSGTTLRSPIESFCVAISDETTNLATGTGKATWRMPYAFTVTDARLSVNTAPTGGTLLTIDINEGAGAGTTILSTKLTLDASEFTSVTAATPRVISDTTLADDANMTADIDAVGSTITGKGAKVCLVGYQT